MDSAEDQAPALEDIPVVSDDDDDDDEEMENEEEWEECGDDAEMQMPDSLCLFCPKMFHTAEQTFCHCAESHNFDIKHVKQLHRLDCFGFIKMVNFIRKTKAGPDVGLTHSPTEGTPWCSDEYMQPVMEDDMLLQFDLSTEEIVLHTDGNVFSDIEDLEVEEDVLLINAEAGKENQPLPQQEHMKLLERLHQAEQRACQAEEQLQRVMEDLHKVRQVTQDLVLSQSADPHPSHLAVQNMTIEDDETYFGSYGHFSIHEEMLKDKVRTEAYRDCVDKNRELFCGKVVLDVGCGTGILSMFAARAGAKLVIGVDQSDIIYQAMDIVRENGLDKTITLLKGRMEDVNLPVDQVDIIISEWMGYFLLFESMLDTVLWARDHYLSPGGLVLPDHCTISLIGLADQKRYDKDIGYWDDVYGFSMTAMKSAVAKEASVGFPDKDTVITDAFVIKDIDVCNCSVTDLEFTSPFKLTAREAGEITCLVGYFDIMFDRCPNKISFSTSPSSTPTHWKQTIFLLESPITVAQGELLEGQLICRKNRKDPRALNITISLQGSTIKYVME